MRYRTTQAAAGLILLCTLLAGSVPRLALTQDRGDNLALITEIEGKVVVQRASDGKLIDGVWGTQLYQGDQVRTTSGAQVSLFFSNNNLITIGPNSSMTIAAGPAMASSDERSVKTVKADLIADASSYSLHRSGAGEIGALGGLRSGGADARIELITPRHTKISTTRPRFEWSTDGTADAYMLEIVDDDGVVWSGEIATTAFDYPEDAPALLRDRRYYWKVEVDDLLDPVETGLVPFEILSEDALRDVEAGRQEIDRMFVDAPTSASHDYVLGLFYAKEGLLAAAIDSFSKISAQHANAAHPHEILGRIYYDVGLKDHAVQSLQRALTLSGAE